MKNEAKSPYNFIPLNDKVVKVEQPDFDFSVYHKDRYNGYLRIKLETKTPLFIKGEEYNFFSIGDNIKIPGSSLRGMIRSLLEIVTYSKLNYVDTKRRFYYRWVAGSFSTLRKYYAKKMKGVQGGYLSFNTQDDEYFITPAKSMNGKTFTKFRDNSKQFKYEKQYNGSWKVWSGMIQGKKHNWIINKPDLSIKKIFLSKRDLNCYINDENRNFIFEIDNEKKGLLEMANDHTLFPNGVPIFYNKLKNLVLLFGHTKNFRIPYLKTINNHIPENLSSDQITDMTEALFGKKNQWQTRIFFEDADLLPNQDNIFLKESSPKILTSPKPTCFQHYLEQPNKSDKNKIKHWDDSNIKIRGRKLYWHRNPPMKESETSWSEGSILIDTQHIKIKPLRKDLNFTSRIRFENLSKIELGALLFVLNLPNNCFHKIGMGKPLGLGSIHIKTELFLIDRIKRYSSLFKGLNWQQGLVKSDFNKFKNDFEKFMLDNITEKERNNAEVLWDTPILKTLKLMLDWKNTNQKDWSKRTKYLDLNDFKNRRILKEPEEIVGFNNHNPN